MPNKMNKPNIVTSLNFGHKYMSIKEHWLKRINKMCSSCDTIIIDNFNHFKYNINNEYAWWDVVRLDFIIQLIQKTNKNVIHIDQDIIIEKDINPLIELPYDIIISTEIGQDKAFPSECSKILGFGVCSGFYVLKPSSFKFIQTIFNNMISKKYNSYSDQVNMMNYIVNNKHTVTNQEITLDNNKYINKIIEIDDIKICVLDFGIITRDPIVNNGQFGNHINIDNVGGTYNFINYFYHDLEKLPLTCRCGKSHLGDNNICPHINIRK